MQDRFRGGRFRAALRQRCPRCLEGAVYSGVLAMNERCPSCGLVFEREHGYFMGAMAVSYALAVPALVLVTALVWVITGWPIEWTLLVGDVLFLPLVPSIFRYSRVFWMYFDRALDPDD